MTLIGLRNWFLCDDCILVIVKGMKEYSQSTVNAHLHLLLIESERKTLWPIKFLLVNYCVEIWFIFSLAESTLTLLDFNVMWCICDWTTFAILSNDKHLVSAFGRIAFWNNVHLLNSRWCLSGFDWL